MRKQFVITDNVKRFVDIAKALQNRADGVPGLAVVWGRPGLGKTETAVWYMAQNIEQVVYLSARPGMTINWFLDELVTELGEAPGRHRQEMFRQAKEHLVQSGKLVLIDESDFLTSDSRVLETVRALHDATGAPFILLGMQEFPRKIRRYAHFYDRIIHFAEFKPLDQSGVKHVAERLCDVKLADDAIAYITERSNGRMRHVVRLLYYAERRAKVNGLKMVSLKDLGRGERRVQ